jgi:CheY-like chemotaxis protein
LSADLPSRLVGDEARIRYLLSRLLSPRDAQLLHFAAKAEKLDEKHVELVFSAVWLLPPGASAPDLPVSAGLCRAMGGKLAIEADESECKLEAALPQAVEDWLPAGQCPAPAAPFPPLSPKAFLLPETVLLAVDDAPINLTLLCGMLAAFGAQAFSANSGEEAEQFLESHAVDLVFLDLSMPQQDGLATIARLRGLKNGKEIPIIAMTAGSSAPGLRDQLLKASFDDFLAKPFDHSRLDYLLKKWLPKERRKPMHVPEDALPGEGGGQGA